MLAFLQNIGMGELLIILMIFLLLFGAAKLPEIARSFGKATKEFKKGIKEVDEELEKKQDTDS